MNNQLLKSEKGSAVLFFMAAMIPLLVLAGVIALDLNADRVNFNTAIRNAQRSSQRFMGTFLTFALNRFDNLSWSLSGTRTVKTEFTPSSPIVRALIDQEKAPTIPIYSTSRIVPTSVSLIFSKETFQPHETLLLKQDILKIWELVEGKRIPFELAVIREDSVLRLTSSVYQKTSDIHRKAAIRTEVLERSFEASSADSIPTEALLHFARNLVFSTAKERHMQHVVFLLGAAPFGGMDEAPLEHLKNAGLCNEDALEYSVIALEINTTQHPAYWSDKKICGNGKALTISLDRAHLKEGNILKTLESVLRSVLHVEVVT